MSTLASLGSQLFGVAPNVHASMPHPAQTSMLLKLLPAAPQSNADVAAPSKSQVTHVSSTQSVSPGVAAHAASKS